MRNRTQALLCLSLLVTVPLGCTATNSNIDPRADAALRRMSDTLAAAKSFRMHSTATIEERLDSGQVAQFSRDSVVSVSRPDRLQAEVRRGPDSYRIWRQGEELTVLDVGQNVYCVVQTPGHIGDTLDLLAEKYGIVVPLDDLLYPNPYEVLIEQVKSGDYLGQQEIGGHKCDHLLFTQDNVDWQIWIDAGTQAVPRKVVITHKDDPDRPQYESLLDDWQLNPQANPAQFTPQLPKSAGRVDIEDLRDSD